MGALQSAAVASPGAQLLGKALQLGALPQDHVGEGNPHTVVRAAIALHAEVEEHRGTPQGGALGRPGRWQKPALVEAGSCHLSALVVALPTPQRKSQYPYSKCQRILRIPALSCSTLDTQHHVARCLRRLKIIRSQESAKINGEGYLSQFSAHTS